MRTRRIGTLEVSEVGLGCNNFGHRIDAAATDAVVGAALDAGITLFDTADTYGKTRSEEYLGHALGVRRDEAIVATKFGNVLEGDPDSGGGSARWIERAVEASLRRLGTDRIDLYQLHVPDAGTPIEETLEALDRLVSSGKVIEIGCSNFSVDQIDEAEAVSESRGLSRFICVQNQYSLLDRTPEAGVLDACARHGLGFLPFFPLHAGLLTGKYRAGAAMPEGARLASLPAERLPRFYNEDLLATVARLQTFCESRGRTLLELAFSWLLSKDVVASVIAGATRPEQIGENVAAASWDLNARELAEVDAILAGAN